MTLDLPTLAIIVGWVVSSTAYFPIDAALREIVLCDGNDATTLSAVDTYLDTAL